MYASEAGTAMDVEKSEDLIDVDVTFIQEMSHDTLKRTVAMAGKFVVPPGELARFEKTEDPAALEEFRQRLINQYRRKESDMLRRYVVAEGD